MKHSVIIRIFYDENGKQNNLNCPQITEFLTKCSIWVHGSPAQEVTFITQFFSLPENHIHDFVPYCKDNFGFETPSLQHIFFRLFGGHLDKVMARTNWFAQYLSKRQLSYAALDPIAVIHCYTKLQSLFHHENREKYGSGHCFHCENTTFNTRDLLYQHHMQYHNNRNYSFCSKMIPYLSEFDHNRMCKCVKPSTNKKSAQDQTSKKGSVDKDKDDEDDEDDA